MYNGEKRASQNSYDRTTAPMLSVQDDSRLSLEVQNLYEVSFMRHRLRLVLMWFIGTVAYTRGRTAQVQSDIEIRELTQ